MSASLFAGNKTISPDKEAKLKQWLQNQPLAFIENKGQFTTTDGNAADYVLFKTTYGNCDIYITTEGLSYVFVKREGGRKKSEDGSQESEDKRKESEADKRRKDEFGASENEDAKKVSYYRLDMKLEGANIDKANILKEQPGKQGHYNYFYAHCPQGIYDVQEYGKITIKNIYQGIDWVIYTNPNTKDQPLKYDFIVHPGADYKDIQLKFLNAQSTSLSDKDTRLKIETIAGTIEEGNLYAFLKNEKNKTFTEQSRSAINDKSEVKCIYAISNDSSISFEIAAYDTSKTLVIDPLVWATYYGGSGHDTFNSITIDSQDNIYIMGYTSSINFPLQYMNGAYNQSSIISSPDISISKFNSHGQRLWATYYGGSASFISICMDNQDNVYISGNVNSLVFPTQSMTGAYNQLTSAGSIDIFILKFNNQGQRLWATYYGGAESETIQSICSDSQGNIYLTGQTSSLNFPIQQLSGAYWQAANTGVNEDAFIIKFNNQCQRQWATYYGGNQTDNANSVHADSQDNIYITGETYSAIFPTQSLAGAYNQSSIAGNYDVFILKFNSQGQRLWATYYGGNYPDDGYSICSDVYDNIYITGYTDSQDFPIQQLSGAYNQTVFAGGADIFILKFNSLGQRQWATYYGGSNSEVGVKIKVDNQGNIYITGNTSSFNLPVQSLAGTYNQASNAGNFDAFFLKFNKQGVRQWASYYGANYLDNGRSIAVDSQNSVYFLGECWGSGAYTVDYGNGAYYDNSWNGDADGCILKFIFCNVEMPVSALSSRNNICANDTGSIILTANGGIGNNLCWYTGGCAQIYVGSGTSITIPSPTQTTTYYASRVSCDTSYSPCVSVTINVDTSSSLMPASVQSNRNNLCINDNGNIILTANGGSGDTLKWYTGNCGQTYIGSGISITLPVPLVSTSYYARWESICDTSACNSILIKVNPTQQTALHPIICQGEVFQVGLHNYTSSGLYKDTLSTYLGCDSIVTTNLTVAPKKQMILNPVICQGEVVTVGTHAYAVTGNYKDTLTTYMGCDSIVITNLTVNPIKQSNLNAVICHGEIYTVGTHHYTITGIYTDVLSTTSGCDSTITTNLTVKPSPVFDFGKDNVICEGDSIALIINTGYTTYQWQDGSTNNHFIVKQPGIFWVTVNYNNCIKSDTITYVLCEPPLNIWVPNAFTPNGDALNDIFKIESANTIKDFHLYIYNRWGQLIFESDDIQRGWDGSFKEKLSPDGVYVWKLQYHWEGNFNTYNDGEKNGKLTLIR
ncbi:MAG: SBBP repeat-containing protein [Bacteroidales bacterium]